MKQELIIIAAIILIALAAFGMEHLTPDTVRIVAIVLCFILLAGFVGGYVARARRRAGEESRTTSESGPQDPEGRS